MTIAGVQLSAVQLLAPVLVTPHTFFAAAVPLANSAYTCAAVAAAAAGAAAATGNERRLQVAGSSALATVTVNIASTSGTQAGLAAILAAVTAANGSSTAFPATTIAWANAWGIAPATYISTYGSPLFLSSLPAATANTALLGPPASPSMLGLGLGLGLGIGLAVIVGAAITAYFYAAHRRKSEITDYTAPQMHAI